MNFAQLLGPMVGGAIYQAGGFYLPFLTMGSLQVRKIYQKRKFWIFSYTQILGQSLICYILQVFMGIVCACCLPRESLTSTGAKTCRKLSILKILKIPTIWFSFTGFIVATMCNGFLSINLEPQVSKSDIYCKTGKYPLRGYLLGVRTASSALESQRLRMTT